MASLVADYASSDDESPAPALVARPPQPADDGDIDDDAAEQQARADVFGLKGSETVVAPGTVAGRLGGAAVAHVSAAPDVLAEVSIRFQIPQILVPFTIPHRFPTRCITLMLDH
jgi:hypothetical protein